ncbi:MAG: cation:proton antiporter [Gammaproteobacteria bacterium]|jgi:multicomponent Na+:H+ antiporter subunit F|nr:cation:proton antiporter [Gammaproteobacteria bacterium]MBT3489459.1 cation:proton antiporter [Gammaproteobacteria bacterium]MBT3718637.1 cation:proton antiporter [Gammaproteobacteria bacterium]MBT3844768.1 cation:proton antiporter [Gammaproteobacteria bacterium]MBT3892821.1 cation:proton antiporter [Gammaproteobacteria bacterium]
MSFSLLQMVALLLLGMAVILSVIRFLIGPTTADRIVAADTVAVIATGGIVMLTLMLESALYLDLALLFGMLSFIGVVVLAQVITAPEQDQQETS